MRAWMLVGCVAACAPTPTPIPAVDTSSMEPQVAELISTSRAAVESNRDDATAWARLARVLHAHRELDAAITSYQHARSLLPTDGALAYTHACAARERFDAPEHVAGLFEEAAALLPEYAPLHCRLGQLYMTSGAYEPAEQAFSKALALDSQLTLARRGLGHAQLSLGQHAAGIANLERVVGTWPQDQVAWAALARGRRLVGDAELAQQATARAAAGQRVESLPDPLRAEVEALAVSTMAVLARADALLASGEADAAAALLTGACERAPEDPWAWRNLALARRRSGDTEGARTAALRSLELAPGFALARLELGKLAETQEDWDTALDHYRAIVEAEPEHAAGWARLGATQFKAGNVSAALEAFAEGDRRAVLGPEALTDWGVTWLAAEVPEQAAAAFERALTLDPALDRAHLGLRRARTLLGR